MRWKWSRLAVTALPVLTAPAGAQMLDLGAGPAPVVDAFTASAELASFLDSQAAEILARADDDAPLLCASALRTLASSLLRSGHELGDQGAERLITARKLVRALPDLDAHLTQGAVSAAMCRLAADDLLQLAAAPPQSQPALDRALRNALAPLTNELLEPPRDDPPPSLATLVRPHAQVDATAFERLDGLLMRAFRLASHASSARRTHDAVAQALPVLDVPGWVTPAARDALARVLVQAVSDLADGSRPDPALAQLDRLAAFSSAIARVDAMPDSPLRRAAVDRLCTLAIELETDGPHAGRAAHTLAVVFAVADRDGMESLEPWLPTPLRLAWRAEQTELDRGRQRLQAAMIELLDRPDPMIEPALLSALRGYRQTRTQLERIALLGAALTGQEPAEAQVPSARPQVLKPYRRLATPLLQAGRDMANPAAIESSRTFIASLAEMAACLQPFPGEDELRATASMGQSQTDAQAFWNLATGRRAADLVAYIDQRRQEIAEALSAADAEAIAADALHSLRGLRTCMQVICEARSVLEAGPERLNALAAFELSEHAWHAAVQGLTDRLAASTGSILAGEPFDADEFAAVRLLAALGAAAAPAPSDSARAVLAQIALGTPDVRSWPNADRVALAVVCRDLEELASARLRAEHERASRLEQAIRSTAAQVLDSRRAFHPAREADDGAD